MRILVIHGPNLNMLGKRDPQKYGYITLYEINQLLRKLAKKLNCQLDIIQSNHEGVLIDFLQKDSSRAADGLLINPGALIRYSYCFRQAIVDFGKLFVEVHLSDINENGVNKKVNIFDDVLTRVDQILGLKERSYLIGLKKLVKAIKQQKNNVILIGMKGCGKTTLGKLLARKLSMDFIEIDDEIEKYHLRQLKEQLTCRQVYQRYGQRYFRHCETAVLKKIYQNIGNKNFVLSCGGGTPLKAENIALLKKIGKIIFLDLDKKILLSRIIKNGIPPFFTSPKNPKKSLELLLKERIPLYQKAAELTIKLKNETVEEIAEKIISLLPKLWK